MVVMLEVVVARAGPTVAQSATTTMEQTGRPSEEEGSMTRAANEVRLGATLPPQVEAPEVERVKGDAPVASLGIMVMAQTAASVPTRETVSAGGLPQEGSVPPRANAKLP
jgi:hypothetical protein